MRWLYLVILCTPLLSREIVTDEYSGFLFPKESSFSATDSSHRVYERIDLTDMEIESAEELLRNHMKSEHPEIFSKLKRYARQYAGLSLDQERVIYINCFIRHPFPTELWHSQMIWVKDGGNDYFQVMINLNTKQCFNLRINGES